MSDFYIAVFIVTKMLQIKTMVKKLQHGPPYWCTTSGAALTSECCSAGIVANPSIYYCVFQISSVVQEIKVTIFWQDFGYKKMATESKVFLFSPSSFFFLLLSTKLNYGMLLEGK